MGGVDADEYASLQRIARAAAMRRMTLSAGPEVEAVVSEAVTQLLEYRRHHDIKSPEALVSVIASRAAIKARDDWERRRLQRGLLEEKNEADDEEDVHGRATDAEIAEVLKGRWESLHLDAMRVMAAIAALGEGDREIAELTLLEDLRPAEVAPRVHKPVGTVKNRLVEIRKALRRALDERG